MATLQELGRAFNSFRKRSKKPSYKLRYPKELVAAVNSFARSSPSVSLKDLSGEIGVTTETLKRWLGGRSNAPHSEKAIKTLEVINDTSPTSASGIAISARSVTLTIQDGADEGQIRRLIELLIAG